MVGWWRKVGSMPLDLDMFSRGFSSLNALVTDPWKKTGLCCRCCNRNKMGALWILPNHLELHILHQVTWWLTACLNIYRLLAYSAIRLLGPGPKVCFVPPWRWDPPPEAAGATYDPELRGCVRKKIASFCIASLKRGFANRKKKPVFSFVFIANFPDFRFYLRHYEHGQPWHWAKKSAHR